MINLPNKLTILRILLIPVILVLLLPVYPGKMLFPYTGNGQDRRRCYFYTGALTDMLDGAIAEKKLRNYSGQVP